MTLVQIQEQKSRTDAATIAATFGCTPRYVRDVLKGNRPINSDLSKRIKTAAEMLIESRKSLQILQPV